MMDAQLLADFLTHHDESAFGTLVSRHGPMVLRVCRDVLGDPSDAEDAFQATFLVLVRRAGAIRDRSSLGPWLYEVAWRISRRARANSARRRAQQRQVLAMYMDAASVPPSDPARHELKPILHEEIHRLPAKIRDAIVLCYLEEFTVEVAARRLHCPVGTLKSRLSRGRELLRSRLVRRGLSTSAMLFLFLAFSDGASAATLVGAADDLVPSDLLDSTVKAGMRVAGGRMGGGVSARVSAMVREEVASARRAWALAGGALLVAIMALDSSWVSVRGLAANIKAAPPGPAALWPESVLARCRSRDGREFHSESASAPTERGDRSAACH
jgi:RNA polymerase sigma factor (sigma-70 family)